MLPQQRSDRGAGAARGGARRVAVVDIDAHHGNGTQAIFYDRTDVLAASVHVDPGAGWFPHHVGFADETGRGAGEGANLNLPLPEGTGDQGWLAAVGAAVEAVARFDPGAVVLSLGVDAAADDPESPLRVTDEGYRCAAQQVAALGPPVSPSKRADTTCRPSGGSWPRHWTASPAEGQLRPPTGQGFPQAWFVSPPAGMMAAWRRQRGMTAGRVANLRIRTPVAARRTPIAAGRCRPRASAAASGRWACARRAPRKAMSTTRSPPARSPPTLEPGALSGPMSAWFRCSRVSLQCAATRRGHPAGAPGPAGHHDAGQA